MDEEALRQDLMTKASIGSSTEILNDQEESMAQEQNRDAYDVVYTIDGETPSLKSQGAAQYEWIARMRAGSLPQEQVPPEILGHIFKYCVDTDFSMVDIPLHPRTQGVMLSHICSRWRRVALAEPGLWNAVSMDDPSRIHPEALDTLLSRAGNTIAFSLRMVHIPPPVLHVLRQYSDKFQSVKLGFDFSRAVEHLNVPFTHLGALQKLRLEVKDNLDDPVIFQLHDAMSAFADPSCLGQIAVFELDAPEGNVDLGYPPSQNLPWSHLERLMVHCEMPFATFYQILSQCVRLEPCEIGFDWGEEDNEDPITSTLPNLSSLILKSPVDNLDGVLGSICTPSLRVLDTYDTPIELDTLLGFIQRSKCHLQTLKVAPVSLQSPHIEELLLAVSGVVWLTLLGTSILGEPTLEAIATGDILPNVEVLECCVLSFRAVRQLISNRCEPNAGGSKNVIRKLTLWVPEDYPTAEWLELQASLPQNGAIKIYFDFPEI